MEDIIYKAYIFAKEAHDKQVRKYTNEPYINHCINVSGILSNFYQKTTPEMKCAALLHDILEDTEVTFDDLHGEFGRTVARMVNGLTDKSKLEDGNREYRKEIDRNWIASQPSNIQLIKVADLIENSRTILIHDKDFAKIYIKEKYEILKSLNIDVIKTNLFSIAYNDILEANKELKIEGIEYE